MTKEAKLVELSLHELAASLNTSLGVVPDFERAWVFNDQVAVVDFRIGGKRIAFDLLLDQGAQGADQIQLLVFSRDGEGPLAQHFPIRHTTGKHLVKTIDTLADAAGEATSAISAAIPKLRESMLPKPAVPRDTRLVHHARDPMAAEPALDRGTRQNPDEPFTIRDVVTRDMCIGCGACSVATDGKVRMAVARNGMYKAEAEDVLSLDGELFLRADSVCPFSDSARNEDALGPPIRHAAVMPFDTRLGRYCALFAGRENNDARLVGSSSGGLTSWLLKKLLISGRADGIIHVGNASSDPRLYEYRISATIEDIDSNRKSFYYSTTLSEVLDTAKAHWGKKFAIVGVPCFVKAARLLAESDPILTTKLAWYIGIVCGHMKSSLFAESSAWQVGVPPANLAKVDFRVKVPNKKASQYEFSANARPAPGLERSEGQPSPVSNRAASMLLGGSWGYGFFQPNACNYCDDVFAETADVVFGDAWLPKYIDDWRGTNVVALRNPELIEVFQAGIDSTEINVENISLDDIVRSQAGGLRHRRAGLRVRLQDDLDAGLKAPARRVAPGLDGTPQSRIDLLRQRKRMSERSFETFLNAKDSGRIEDFTVPMAQEVALYKYIESHSYPSVKKQIYYDVALFGWHHQANLGGVLTFFVLHQVLKAAGFSVVVVWGPGRTGVNPANRDNYEILKKYYRYSKYRSPDKLHELRNYCNYFVLASDQLWAGKWITFNPEYEFLGCGDESVKRISVSTSFGGAGGSSLPFEGDKAAIVTHLLRSMDHISVREPNGVDILKNLGIEGTQILDPVFLAPPSAYEDLMTHATVSLSQGPYVMSYILDEQAELVNFAKDVVTRQRGAASAYFMTTMNNATDQKSSVNRWAAFGNVNFLPHSSFADLIRGVAGADFVFTDSFHGACLAVIFQKPFICCPPGSRGQSRFLLFEQLGLGDRILPRNAPDAEVVNQPIDWSEVNSRLRAMRSRSFAWLSNAFGRDFGAALPADLWP